MGRAARYDCPIQNCKVNLPLEFFILNENEELVRCLFCDVKQSVEDKWEITTKFAKLNELNLNLKQQNESLRKEVNDMKQEIRTLKSTTRYNTRPQPTPTQHPSSTNVPPPPPGFPYLRGPPPGFRPLPTFQPTQFNSAIPPQPIVAPPRLYHQQTMSTQQIPPINSYEHYPTLPTPTTTFQQVNRRKSIRPQNNNVTNRSEVAVSVKNRFDVLSDNEEGTTFLYGDSLIRSTGLTLAKYNRKRQTTVIPGGRIEHITNAIKKETPTSKNQCIVANVGSCDAFSKARVRSADIVNKYRNMITEIKNKSNRGIVVGIYPRFGVDNYSLSRAIGINQSLKNICKQEKVDYIDVWDSFYCKKELYRQDGIHLSTQGVGRLSSIINRQIYSTCERAGN